MFRDSRFLFFSSFKKKYQIYESSSIAEYFIQIDGLVVRIKAAEMPGASN